MPRVSIITLCHNDEQYLPECIASVQAQTYTDYEHIIVDVASDLPVWAADFRILRPLGISSARNYSWAWSQGELVMHLDADDKIHPRYLEHVVEHAGRGVIVCPQLIEFGGRRGTAGIPNENDCTLAGFLKCNPIYYCSMYHPADYSAAGGYDYALDWLGCEDYELWTGMVSAGCRVKVVPEALFYYRVRAGSFTEQLGSAMDEGRAYVRKKHG